MVGISFSIGGNVTTWISWAVSLGLLTGSWVIVALVAGAQAPTAEEAGRAGVVSMDGPMTVRRHTYPLWIERKTPCVGDVVSLDLLLTLEVKSKLDGEWATFAVQAWLISNESRSAPDRIAPVQAHFGFSSPQYGQAGHVHQIRTPVLGLAGPVDVVVPLEQGVNDQSQLIVKPGQVQFMCG